MIAFFKKLGKIELEAQLLQLPKIKSPKMSAFCLIRLVAMFVLYVALFVLRLLISFMISRRSI